MLVTHAHATVVAHGCGRLIQPRHYSKIRETAEAGIPWAADNDCFNGGLDVRAWLVMLSRLTDLPGCLFVVAPDAVGDHETTLALWGEWRKYIKAHHQPAAFVLQNGCPAGWYPPDADAVFIGGDDAYKLGADARESAAAAKRDGKWVHMGRVNSRRRIRYAASIGCDSVDGSGWARFPALKLADGVAACWMETNQLTLGR